jgi:hypothetical protein
MVLSDKPQKNKEKKSWIDLINESVHTSDDINIGDIDALSRDFIVVKRGFVNVHYYYREWLNRQRCGSDHVTS